MRRATAVVATACALAGAGCAGGDEGSGTRSAADPEEAELAFARCMREHGIDAPDPVPGGGPTRLRIDRRVSPQAADRAARTCRERTGSGHRELSADEREDFHDGLLALAQCFRRHGVEVPDPELDDDGGAIVLWRRGSRNPRVDVSSPAFRRADAACRDERPRLPWEDGA